MEATGTFLGTTGTTRAEFDELVRRFHRHAYNVAYRMVGNQADAEDLTQEAFVRAYRFFDRYNRSMPFENWMYRIISNVFIDEWRRRPKFRSQSLDQPIGDSIGEVHLEIPDTASDPQHVMMQQTIAEPIQHALNALPAEFRQAVILADIEGLSYEEIADVMHCSVGTVRSRLHRGRKQLRNRMNGKSA
jgi:RNA polymerase sigma-70 factor, ECF subfamily